RIPVALAIAAISDQGSSEPLLLVQEADISARKRLDAMRDTVVAIREVIVTANGWDKAAPALLASLCAHLDWDAAQYWSVEGDRHALKLRNSLHKESSNVDGMDDPARTLSTTGVEIGQFIQRAETEHVLRRSEADHRAIYERSPIGIARVSSEGELLEGNPALLHMLEHDMDSMRSQAWPNLLRAYDQAASRARLAPLLAGITDQRSVQVRAATGGGSWLWLQLTTTSIPDATGAPQPILVMVQDLTTVRAPQAPPREARA